MTTRNKRQLPADLQDAIARHVIVPTICKPGKKAVPASIMRAAERGALKGDVRAARAGLVVPAIRSCRSK